MSWTLSYTGATPLSSGTQSISFTRSGSFASTDVLSSIDITVTGRITGLGIVNLDVLGLSVVAGTATGSFTATRRFISGGTGYPLLFGSNAIAANWVSPSGTVRVNPTGPASGFSVVISSVSITVTTGTASGSGPTQGGTPVTQTGTTSTADKYYWVFRAQPPSTAAFATGYTTTIHVYSDKYLSSLRAIATGRETGAAGTATLRILGAGNTAISFTIGATTATSHTITISGGAYSGTVTIPSTATNGPYRFEVSAWSPTSTLPSSTQLGTAYSTSWNITGTSVSEGLGNHLAFGTAPATSAQVGDQLASFTVEAKNSSNVTVTGFTGTVTLSAVGPTGQAVSVLAGTLTATASAGVATFSSISFTKPGTYQLKATATAYEPVFSVVLTITGAFDADDIIGLRQNLVYDGTTWRRTTNINSPTLNTMTTAQMKGIDGDMASTTALANDGVRWFLPHPIKLQRIDYKVSVSTLSSTPTIQVYTSQDATSVTDGTWTLQASYTPVHTNVFISAFTFASPIIARGVWVTLNDGGGAATASWRAIHVSGPYLSPTISYQDPEGGETLNDERTLSIPDPPAKISGGATATRRVIMRNNTATTYEITMVVSPARDTGDSLIDGLIIVKDDGGNPVSETFVLGPNEAKSLTFSYTIAAADNDNTGKHYARVSMIDMSESTAYYYFVFGAGTRRYDMAAFAGFTGSSTGGETFTDVLYHPATNSFMYLSNNAGATLKVAGITGLTSYATHTITSAGTAANFSRGVIMGTTAYITNSGSTNVYAIPLVLSNTSTALSAIPIAFALPAQTTGHKVAVQRTSTRMWIMNGSATSNLRIYDLDTAGNVYYTIDTTTNLSGLDVRMIGWDSRNSELYVGTAVSGGSRTFARYDSTGTYVTSISNSDRNTLEVTSINYMNGKIYVLYGGRYLWRYDAQTLANGSEIADFTANTGTGHALIMAFA